MSRYGEDMHLRRPAEKGAMAQPEAEAATSLKQEKKKWKIPIDRLMDGLIVLLCAVLFAMLFAFYLIANLPYNHTNPVVILDSVLPRSVCVQMVKAAEELNSWTTMRHRNYPTTDIPLYLLNDVPIINITHPHLTHSSQKVGIDPKNQVLLGKWMNDTFFPKVIFPQLYQHFASLVLPPWRDSQGMAAISYDPYSVFTIQDVFLVKYDVSSVDSQHHLAMHIDSSMFSFNIALNDFEDIGREHDDHDTMTSLATSSSIHDTLPMYTAGGTRFFLSATGNQSQDGFVNRLSQGSILLHPSKTPHEGVAIQSGIRYILVGFIRHRFQVPASDVLSREKVIPTNSELSFFESWRRYLWISFRKYVTNYGRYSQCIQIQHYGIDAMQGKGEKLTHCKSIFAVVHHEVSEVYRDFFMPPDARRYGGESMEEKDPFKKGLNRMHRFFKKASLLFIGGGVVITLLAGCMMCYESLYLAVMRYKYRTLAKHKTTTASTRATVGLSSSAATATAAAAIGSKTKTN